MESISKRRIDRRLLLSDSPNGTGTGTGTILPRRLLRSSTGHNPLQTPRACLTKTRASSIHQRDADEWDCGSISCELQALAKMMHEEFGVSDSVDFENGVPLISSPLFERGRLYEEYSARRNERLKSKKIVATDEKKNRYDLGVRAEPAKRKDSKKFEGLKKKSNPTTPLKETRENAKAKPVYSLRSITKESKRLSLPLSLTTASSSAVGVERKMAARGSRKF